MARLRYVQDPDKLEAVMASRRAGGGLNNTVRTVRAFYETDPEIVAALLPRPLVPDVEPLVMVQFSHVEMRPAPGQVITAGTATVGVAARYRDRQGWYVLAMPMEGEFVVIGGRERFGEPKKLAEVGFHRDGDRVHVTCTRKGVTIMEMSGRVGESLGPKSFMEHLYCYKAMPNIETNFGFDGDVFLTQLNWQREWDVHNVVTDGQVILRESAHDPIADVPVRRLVRMEYSEGRSITGGEILEKVPGEWLVPFWMGRYDDNPTGGIEVSVAREAVAEHA